MGHIGQRYRVSLRDLQLANPGVKPRTLRIGYKLIIPTGGIPSREVRLAMQGNPNRPSVAYHTVRSGDSIWLISRRYGISQSQLRQWNGLSGDVIRPDSQIKNQESPFGNAKKATAMGRRLLCVPAPSVTCRLLFRRSRWRGCHPGPGFLVPWWGHGCRPGGRNEGCRRTGSSADGESGIRLGD